MVKDSFTEKACAAVLKYSIFTLALLMPVFFLPWTTDALDFNKQALFMALVFVALFAWMLKTMVTGRLEISKTPLHIFAGVLFLMYLLSAVFSVNRYGSFWGWPQITSQSLLSAICLFLLYFLVSNAFSKKDIYKLAAIASFSGALAMLIGVFQLFGVFLPFDFAKAASFNTVGSVTALGFLASILLPLATVLMIIAKKWWRIMYGLEIFLSALVLVMINFQVIWWSVFLGAVFVMVLGIIKRDLFDGRWMALPMFFLAISLFFVLLSPGINFMPQRVNEIFLSQRTSLGIAGQTLKERPLFGSGLGTFGYDFSRFKDPDFNKSSLWNTSFNSAGSKILNEFATTGILGALAFLALAAVALFKSIKIFVTEKEVSSLRLSYIMGFSAVLFVWVVASFLYSPNFVLDFIGFLALASLTGLAFAERKEYELKPSSIATLAATFAFTLLLIFGLGLLILGGQRYFAEASYFKGLMQWQADKKDDGLRNMEKAATINSGSDLYFRQLAQAYLLKLQDEVQNPPKNVNKDEEAKKIQTLVANSVNASKIATDLGSKNVNNWSVRGYIYQNMLDIMSDASQWSLNSYDEALKLDPNNSYLLAQKGNVLFVTAKKLPQEQAEQKNLFLSQAKDQLEKAASLNPSYSNALYSLGLTYDALDQKDKAIEQFNKVLQLNPGNKDIEKIINNLKNGLPALQTASPLPENPPAENSSSQTSKDNQETKK